ncbi:MAG: RNA pyrophosphohydrolase [Candidatus Pelagibacter sp.]
MAKILEKFKNLPLRRGVGVVVLNKENKVFVGRRIDNPKNFWQMPQGGVDEGENFLNAALRELKEETGIKNVELIQEIEGIMTYELPANLLGIIWKGKYRGQKQKWFLMRFLGKDDDINIKTEKPEFLDWKWLDLNEITETVVDFKLHIYEELKVKIQKIIN